MMVYRTLYSNKQAYEVKTLVYHSHDIVICFTLWLFLHVLTKDVFLYMTRMM